VKEELNVLLNIGEWFQKIGRGSNEPLSIQFPSEGRVVIANDDGEVATLANDWDVFFVAADMAALDELCARDLALMEGL
jgi:hypothetical protein